LFKNIRISKFFPFDRFILAFDISPAFENTLLERTDMAEIIEYFIAISNNGHTYLGIYIDRHLTWLPHIKSKVQSLSNHLHFLHPLLISKNIKIPNKLLI